MDDTRRTDDGLDPEDRALLEELLDGLGTMWGSALQPPRRGGRDRGRAGSGSSPDRPRNRTSAEVREAGAEGVRPFLEPEERVRADPDQPARWVPPGEEVDVAGIEIPEGMVYVGASLPSLVDPAEVDPSLVDPRLAVEVLAPDRSGAGLPFWPSYRELGPRARAAYLRWLADGRRDPSYGIAYPFLFLYGLERRVLVDAETSPEARAEVPALRRELRALLATYGRHGSFREYALGLSRFALFRFAFDIEIEEPEQWLGAADQEACLVHGLGRLARRGRSIDATWARAWLQVERGGGLPASMDVAGAELERLFALRFAARYPEGMALPERRRPLVVAHRPASAALPPATRRICSGLAGYGSASAVLARLRRLEAGCCSALEPFARAWLDLPPGRRDEARRLLPEELREGPRSPACGPDQCT